MTYVVTGGSGFLGSRVVRDLVEQGHEVLNVDRVSASPHEPASPYYQSNLEDPSAIFQQVKASPITLIHLAWDMRRSAGYAIQSANILTLAGLLEAAEPHDLQRVVAMGSAEEYGRAAGVLDEKSEPIHPLSPYGWAKRSAGELVRSWSARNGIPAIWLRPFIIYGPGQGGDLVVPYAVRQALTNESAAFSDGLQERDFVFVDDVADAVVRAAVRPGLTSSALSLGTGKPVRVRAILEEVARAYSVDGLFQFGKIPRRPNEPEIQIAETSRARTLLGWEAEIGWQEGIQRIFDAGAENP